MTRVLRLAMWSGPRNISTAMMRAWGNRSDTIVCDEPLYAHYLRETGLPHPGAAEVIAHHESDWRKVVAELVGPLPPGKTIYYQKQMAHHLLPCIELNWLDHLTHCFLIREPREMLTSLLEFIPHPVIADTGLPQQLRIFHQVRENSGNTPPVLDAKDVLENPEGILRACCQMLQIPFQESMLQWPAGRRSTDGIWAKYWYDKVEKTTSFGPYRTKDESVPTELQTLLAECERLYAELREHRIRA
jgi:hypothetical protein